jgi:predicted ferric reductase
MILKISIVFSFCSLLLLILFSNAGSLTNITSILGYFGILGIFWSIILGSKPLTKWLGLDYQKVNKIHKFLGKYGIFFVLIHPFLGALVYLENFSWIFKLNFSSPVEGVVSMGRVALLLYLIIWVSSVILRSKLKYRPWIRIHYLSYPLFLSSLLHIPGLGYFWNDFVIVKVLWSIVLALYIVYLGYIGLLFAGFFKKKYRLSSIQIFGKGSKIAILDCVAIGKSLNSIPGQYVYLSLKPFGEAKPFSILWNEGEKIKLGIKLEGEFTQLIHEQKTGKIIRLYGPFGNFTQNGHNQKPKIIIAGGIGITPLLQFASRYFTNDSKFIMCNRYRSDTVEFDLLKKNTKKNLYEIYSNEKETTRENCFFKQLDKDILIKILSPLDLDKYDVFICGSDSFTNQTIDNLVTIGVNKNSIFTEKFSI